MVQAALSLAATYKTAEADAMGQLSPGGALLSADAIADCRERLAVWRGAVVSVLLAARHDATEEERRDITAALLLVNTSRY